MFSDPRINPERFVLIINGAPCYPKCYVQPKVCLKTNRCSGGEVLLRYEGVSKSGEWVIYYPNQVLHQIYSSCWARDFSKWVILTTVRYLDVLPPGISLSANIRSNDIDREFMALLEGVSSGQLRKLVLELLEDQRVTNPQKKLICAIGEMGVCFAIDDFPTQCADLDRYTWMSHNLWRYVVKFDRIVFSKRCRARVVIRKNLEDIIKINACQGVVFEGAELDYWNMLHEIMLEYGLPEVSIQSWGISQAMPFANFLAFLNTFNKMTRVGSYAMN